MMPSHSHEEPPSERDGAFRVDEKPIRLEVRQDHWYQVLARLKPGVTVPQAQSAALVELGYSAARRAATASMAASPSSRPKTS